MTNEQRANCNNRIYDLTERTTKFAKDIIAFSKLLPENQLAALLKNQLLRSGTSIGANYHEADSAESRKDFFHKIGICRKEAKETMYWLDIIISTFPHVKRAELLDEA